ncbi:MAG: ribonucleoside-diphosphate reductase subunit alpha [Firmicutes bacterium]|nr:ribonucleoside-diphosphate reductase subunit alpha [Bacillota bacterium]
MSVFTIFLPPVLAHHPAGEHLRPFVPLVEAATEGFPDCPAAELLEDAARHLTAEPGRQEVEDTLVRLANDKVSVERPHWTFVAARLLLARLYEEAAVNRGLAAPGYGDFPGLVRHLTTIGRYDPAVLEAYGEEGLRALGALIRPERDRLLNYPGLKHLADRYAIKGLDNEVRELPQEVFLGVAAYLALAERPEERLAWAERFYTLLSTLSITMATPTLANARKPGGQLSSCFIDTPEDSILGIFGGLKAFAQVSQNGGGMGVYFGHLRALGSTIRGYKDTGNGVIPWARLYNDTAVSVNQLGQRAGAVALWLDVWHKDIVDWLDLKTNNGDERRKAHDVFPGVTIPDAFMRAVEADEPWSLFDPHEVEQVMGWRLEDSWGEEWERRYQACVAEPRLSRVTLPALDLMAAIMKSAYETGGPFLLFRDTANRLNPNGHAGMIYSSNLCTEILQNQSSTIEEGAAESGEGTLTTTARSGDFVVCNLSSIHLGRVDRLEDLETIIPVQVRMLDNVITLNHLPLPQAVRTNRRYRAIGIGVSGYHEHLVRHGIDWESEEHLAYADRLFERINYLAIRASMELAKERGAYPLFPGSDWDTGAYFTKRGYTSPEWQTLAAEVHRHGLRNGYLMAIAPTGSTSVIAGTTASTDPIFKPVFTEEKKGFLIRTVAPGLDARTAPLYKEAHRIDQRWSIRAAAVRQRHLDQSQSVNLYATEDLDEWTFLEWYLLAWKSGLKSLYYFRNFTADEAAPDPAPVCESCTV